MVEAGRALGLRGTVSVRLMDDAAIRALNRRFLGHDWPTDALSFPSAQRPHVGDLAVSVATARRQARQHGHALDVELRILLLHGLLHLAGYDHERDQGQMRRRERALRRQFGLPAGLIERNGPRRRKMNR
ncbi:MAG: rRNA maturation RNase YbeY [Terriglobales bacterium]